MQSKFYGKPVVNIWNGTIRYGVIRESKEQSGWLYVRCTWIDDEAYENDINLVCELRGLDRKDDWLRIDKVSFIDIEEHITKLSKLSYAVRQVDGSGDFNYYLTESTHRYSILT